MNTTYDPESVAMCRRLIEIKTKVEANQRDDAARGYSHEHPAPTATRRAALSLTRACHKLGIEVADLDYVAALLP